MVFDLVRPLGARAGELEVNALGLVPLDRKRRREGEVTDPFGIVTRSPDRRSIEWAPEIEGAILDGLAVEFELPFEDATLEAYKSALQWTIGTALDDRYIHGIQTIVQYDLDPSVWTTSLLYIGGYVFDDVWSALAMGGVRVEAGSDFKEERTEALLNTSVFRHIGRRASIGLETNVAHDVKGSTSTLAMPQIHWEPTDNSMIQLGVGGRFDADSFLPEVGFRVIHSW